MSSIVDHVFPPTSQSPQMALDYSSFTFWREPLPRIVDDVKGENSEAADLEAGVASSLNCQKCCRGWRRTALGKGGRRRGTTLL